MFSHCSMRYTDHKLLVRVEMNIHVQRDLPIWDAHPA